MLSEIASDGTALRRQTRGSKTDYLDWVLAEDIGTVLVESDPTEPLGLALRAKCGVGHVQPVTLQQDRSIVRRKVTHVHGHARQQLSDSKVDIDPHLVVRLREDLDSSLHGEGGVSREGGTQDGQCGGGVGL
jgi:hypothetical protein